LTYWVTKTFLIATVFGVGTALVGAGPGRGAAITVVHTVVLTVYYWSLSPVGLPSHPQWLDLEHTWTTGVPVHFGVVYLGYLGALLLWRGRAPAPLDRAAARPDALLALGAAVAMVVLAGGLASLASWDFPGLTYFVTRLLITFPLVLLWQAVAGRSPVASAAGAVVLALAWTVYGQFLSPLGLPASPYRIFHEAPPPATVEWLDYRHLWLIDFPIFLAVAAVVLQAASVARPADLRLPRAAGPRLAALAAPLALAVPPLVGLAFVDSGGTRLERGGWLSGDLAPTTASMRLAGEDAGGRVTPLPPHDRLSIDATIAPRSGAPYRVTVRRPLVDDPLGRFTTWWGVGVDVWHHGRSGIGTSRIPATRSDVAVFGIGDVARGGRTVARGVPVHAMTTGHGLELDVGDPDVPVAGLPDGHLRVRWDAYAGGAVRQDGTRYAIGGVVLALALALALAAVGRQAVGARG